jgi:hypothetical protein
VRPGGRCGRWRRARLKLAHLNAAAGRQQERAVSPSHAVALEPSSLLDPPSVGFRDACTPSHRTAPCLDRTRSNACQPAQSRQGCRAWIPLSAHLHTPPEPLYPEPEHRHGAGPRCAERFASYAECGDYFDAQQHTIRSDDHLKRNASIGWHPHPTGRVGDPCARARTSGTRKMRGSPALGWRARIYLASVAGGEEADQSWEAAPGTGTGRRVTACLTG